MNLITDEISLSRLGRRRTLRVLLPPDYGRDPDRRWPVLYMQDGHNLFDPAAATYGATWRVPETLAALAAAGRPFGCLVVGVDCNHEGHKRLDEYSPWVNPDIGRQLSRTAGLAAAGGEGEAYLDFLVHDLLPWTASRYRVLPGPGGAAIAGSSMGALISLYAGMERPDLFGAVGAFSPATWFAKAAILDYVAQRGRELTGPGGGATAGGAAAGRAAEISWPAIYVDIGTAETSDDANPDFARIYEEDARELAAALGAAGLPAGRSRLVVEEGADHSERSWARRFPAFLEWLRPFLDSATG